MNTTATQNPDRLLSLLSWWQSWFDLGDDIRVEELCLDPTDRYLAQQLSRRIARRRRLAPLVITSREAQSRR